MDDELRERCRQVTHRTLTARNWRLAHDEAVFVDDVLAEVQSRLSGPPSQSVEKLIEHVVVRRYSRLWHAACRLDGTARQRRAFEEVHQVCYDVARYRFRRNQDQADECAQIALTKVWRNLERVADPDSFLWWVMRIANNEASRLITAGRRKSTDAAGRSVWRDNEITMTDLAIESQTTDDDSQSAVGAHFDPPRQMTDDDRRRIEAAIRACLDNDRYQAVVIKTFFEHKSRQEVAEELSVSPAYVSTYKQRAVKRLRTCREFLNILEDLL